MSGTNWPYDGVTGNLNRSQTKSPVTRLQRSLDSIGKHTAAPVAVFLSQATPIRWARESWRAQL